MSDRKTYPSLPFLQQDQNEQAHPHPLPHANPHDQQSPGRQVGTPAHRASLAPLKRRGCAQEDTSRAGACYDSKMSVPPADDACKKAYD